MNDITLDGIIWGIKDSHKINDVQYQTANITVKNSNGKDSVITLQFKKFQCNYQDQDRVRLSGNVRSHSEKISDTKNKVNIYVYTYFDAPEEENVVNRFQVSGKICKIEDMRYLENQKNNIHFILANNIIRNDCKINSYLPCIAWGKCAKRIEKIPKNKNILIVGELRSREYKKPLDNGQFEFRIAHELLVTDFQELEDEE